MSNYTTTMKEKALNLLKQGKSLAEVRGYIDGSYGTIEDSGIYGTRDFSIDGYIEGYRRGLDTRKVRLEVAALQGR